jgi:hypothetical protein
MDIQLNNVVPIVTLPPPLCSDVRIARKHIMVPAYPGIACESRRSSPVS